MKKLLIILTAIIVFLFPIMQIQQETAHAAIVGKVISKSAKEIAKEIVADAAFETAGNLAYKYAFDDKDGKFKIDPGTKLICLPGGKVDGECTKPAQIDTDFTKAELKPEIDSQLEKHINNGKYFNKWEKFLDWFIPLWAGAFVVTVLTYVMDSDVRTFFNEVAMDTLYALGIIQPVVDITTQTKIPTEMNEFIDQPQNTDSYISVSNNWKQPYSLSLSSLTNQEKNDLMVLTTSTTKEAEKYSVGTTEQYLSIWQYSSNPTYTIGRTNSWYGFLNETEINTLTGEVIQTKDITTRGNFTSLIPVTNTINRIFKFPFINQDGLIQFEVVQKDLNRKYVYVYNTPSEQPQTILPINSTSVTQEFYNFGQTTYKINFKYNPYVSTTIDLPTPEEIAPALDPLKVTPYTEGAIVTMPSPSTIPYKNTVTGEPVHRDEQDPNIWRDPAGDPVPEDNIEVGEPEIIKNPDGSHVAIPQPTPSNPTPTPVQITDPIPEAPITPDEFEDLSCATIKKPKFDPLATAVMTSFPFSIPWDIQRIYEALFANVGSERPEFVFKIPGYDQEFPISMNAYFDDWVPFIRSIILLTFDMGLLYAAYRWTKGGSE